MFLVNDILANDWFRLSRLTTLDLFICGFTDYNQGISLLSKVQWAVFLVNIWLKVLNHFEGQGLGKIQG